MRKLCGGSLFDLAASNYLVTMCNPLNMLNPLTTQPVLLCSDWVVFDWRSSFVHYYERFELVSWILGLKCGQR